MAEPWTFDFDPLEQTFTFSNGHVTFELATALEPPPPELPESVTVESVSLTNPHDTTHVDLGITNVEVPSPVIGHLASHFDLLI